MPGAIGCTRTIHTTTRNGKRRLKSMALNVGSTCSREGAREDHGFPGHTHFVSKEQDDAMDISPSVQLVFYLDVSSSWYNDPSGLLRACRDRSRGACGEVREGRHCSRTCQAALFNPHRFAR